MTTIPQTPGTPDLDASALVVEHDVVDPSSKLRQFLIGVFLVAVGAFTALVFGLTGDGGDAGFSLSTSDDAVTIPDIHVPSRGTAIVLGIVIVLLGAYHAALGFSRVQMRWAIGITSVCFVVGFFCWAGTGPSFTGGTIAIQGILDQSLIAAVPLIFGAMAGVMCERTGVINIAIEGQMLIGAFAGALTSSIVNNTGVGIVFAAVAGGLVGALLAVFAVKFMVNQVVLGVVLNLLVLGLTGYLYQAFMATDSGAYNAGKGIANHSIPGLSDIPVIGPVLFETNYLVYGMYVIIIAINLALFRTRFGLRTRAVGEHPRAAATVGIRVRATRYRNVIIGGMIAGLGGAFLTIGTTTQFQQANTGITAGRGYIALAALIFGRWKPNGALGAALLFGFSLQLGNLFSSGTPANIPSAFWQSVPYLVTIFAVAGLVGKVTAPAADGEPYSG